MTNRDRTVIRHRHYTRAVLTTPTLALMCAIYLYTELECVIDYFYTNLFQTVAYALNGVHEA